MPDHDRVEERGSACACCVGDDHTSPEEGPATSRRAFLLIGLGVLLTGCAPQQRHASRTLPGPVWRPIDPGSRPAPTYPDPRDIAPPAPAPAAPSWVISRGNWTSIQPTYSLMQPLSPVHTITVHHDGMRPFFEVGDRGVVARLEAIRRSHRDVRQWGDIGYHYAVDRNGRVWECRPITHQGAHVANHNEGNLGVLALGNFDQQPLTPAQLDGISRHVSWLMRQYGVPIGRVRTHREWDTARTVCPGTALQRYMDDVRRSGRLA